jgi:hypothetical protein
VDGPASSPAGSSDRGSCFPAGWVVDSGFVVAEGSGLTGVSWAV